MNNLSKLVKTKTRQLYHYLFEFDQEKLSLHGQSSDVLLSNLQQGLLHRDFVLLTFANDTCLIGQITKRVSTGRFVFKEYGQNMFWLIDVDDLFRVDLG